MTAASRRVLLVSPYHTGSHRQWAEGFAAASAHDVRLVTLPGQFWKWRLLAGAVTLAEQVRRHVDRHGAPDVVLATSMTDVAGLVGHARPALDGVPIALYMHENQVTYPATGRTAAAARHGLVTWSSLLAADGVAFNSDFHREAVLEALPRFLGSFPETDHVALVPGVAEASIVLPVGIDLGAPPVPRRGERPRLLWNHRWDPDKRPEEFLAMARDLATEAFDFDVALLGERFANQGADYQDDVDRLGDRVVVAEHVDRARYLDVLAGADVVVSTAVQEFFGVSVVEAIWHGAFPVLPDRLVYPERIPPSFHEACLYRSPSQLRERVRWALSHRDEAAAVSAEIRPSLAEFDWAEVAPRYDAWLGSMTGA